MSMKCPVCESWTTVKETRTRETDGVVRRRYECANMHRFSTEERIRDDELLRRIRELQPRARLPSASGKSETAIREVPGREIRALPDPATQGAGKVDAVGPCRMGDLDTAALFSLAGVEQGAIPEQVEPNGTGKVVHRLAVDAVEFHVGPCAQHNDPDSRAHQAHSSFNPRV